MYRVNIQPQIIVSRQFRAAVWLACALIASPVAKSQTAAPSHDDDPAEALSKSFRCPEDLTSDDERNAALGAFLREYETKFPDKTIDDLLRFRYRLLVSHSCAQTLASMVSNVSPITVMIRMLDQDFGPKQEQYDPETKVWTVRYRSDGKTPAKTSSPAPNELLFNFYGWKPAIDPKDMAEAYIRPRANIRILSKFQAPDEITGKPAFFILSESYPGEPDSFVNLTKITSVGTGAYAVTFSHFMPGPYIEHAAMEWYASQEGASVATGIGRAGVDPAWEQHFNSASASKGKSGSQP